MLIARTRTHPGLVRPSNEDAVVWDEDLALLAIADGMGGHNAGEVASRVALDAVRAFVRDSAAAEDITWPFGMDPNLSRAANRLVTAIKIANRRVHRSAEEHAEYVGMGTTLVAGIVEGRCLTYASVGDSRLYSMQGATLKRLTRDDSWIAVIGEKSGLDAATLKNHPMRHVLTSVIGAQPGVDVMTQELELADGEKLLMCTDGLHGTVNDDAMREMLASEPDLDTTADRLVESALAAGGPDNITLLIARFDGVQRASHES